MVFIVRNDASQSQILYQTDDEMWEAYNQWGDGGLYGGNRAAAGHRGQLQPTVHDRHQRIAVLALQR